MKKLIIISWITTCIFGNASILCAETIVTVPDTEIKVTTLEMKNDTDIIFDYGEPTKSVQLTVPSNYNYDYAYKTTARVKLFNSPSLQSKKFIMNFCENADVVLCFPTEDDSICSKEKVCVN